MAAEKSLFVRQSITIQASAEKVWRVLTEAELTRSWVREFFDGQDAELVSEWKMGSAVEWKLLSDGKTYVEGNVTALEPGWLLRYTVFDVRSARPPVTAEDGITFTLNEQNGQTMLSVKQGDFGVMDDGEKYYNASASIWQHVLPNIKTAAEKL